MLALAPDPKLVLAACAAEVLLGYGRKGDLFAHRQADLRCVAQDLRNAGADACAALLVIDVAGVTIPRQEAFYGEGLQSRLLRFKFARRWEEYFAAVRPILHNAPMVGV